MPSAEFHRRQARGGGFILLEVLLAAGIFCLVAVALMNGLGDTADAIRRSNRESQVRLALESRLAEARALPVEVGVRQEKADDAGIAYEREWKAIQPVNQTHDALPGLFQLTVRARWTERNAEERSEATITVYRPQL